MELEERAGNTSTEEIIMAIKTRQDQFGVDIKAETTEIFETSRLVSKLTGYPVQYNKAVVGKKCIQLRVWNSSTWLFKKYYNLRNNVPRLCRARSKNNFRKTFWSRWI